MIWKHAIGFTFIWKRDDMETMLKSLVLYYIDTLFGKVL